MRHGLVHVATAVGLVALVAAFAFSAGTANAPAGGMPEGELTSFMDKVAYGGNAVYTATFTHLGQSQTHVRYHNPIPESTGDEQAGLPRPVYASCEGTLTETEFVCDPIKLKKGDVATVTIVWKTFTEGSSDCEGAEPCFANEGFWTTDSGSNAPQKPKKTTSDILEIEFADGDSEAATYALGGCNPEDPEDLEELKAAATLATSEDLFGPDNPLASYLCVPDFETGDPVHKPGLVGTVLERDVDENDPEGALGQGSEVCVADTDCDDPFDFAPARITFLFLIDEETFFPPPVLLQVSPVTKVFHDGAELLRCDDLLNPDTDPCVQSIESDGDGTTTVLATGTDNGEWTFG